MTHFEKFLLLLTIFFAVYSIDLKIALEQLKASSVKVDVSVYPQLTNSIIIQFKVPK